MTINIICVTSTIGTRWIELERIDEVGPKGTNWTERDQIGLNKTEVDKLDRSGTNRSNMD